MEKLKKEPRFRGEVSRKSHECMSHIRGKDTSIEVRLRKALWAKGYRFRKNYRKLPGTPDIALTKHRIAVFCDSEFFHGKDWEKLKAKLQQGKNSEYWIRKIERNIERDNEKDTLLRSQGWTVIHFWGKEIQNHLDECVLTIDETVFDLKLMQGDAAEDNCEELSCR